MLRKFLPFLTRFRGYSLSKFRVDFVAGLTVALVLVPQSMAYAQLAGLPAYYGLYASVAPPMIAALFGSSRQLATGPVAVVSLMTAASLQPLAAVGSEAFIAYAILLAFVVGVFQLALGVLRLGLVVNFLSHPVVNGFTNGAAIIIATSQLSKMFGVHVDGAEHHYETVYRVVMAAVHYLHWPTLLLGAGAFALMYLLKRINPRFPYVLVAVVLATVLSWAIGFHRDEEVHLDRIESAEVRRLVEEFNRATEHLTELARHRAEVGARLAALSREAGEVVTEEQLAIEHERDVILLRIERERERVRDLRARLRRVLLVAEGEGEARRFRPWREGDDGRIWRIRVGRHPLDR